MIFISFQTYGCDKERTYWKISLSQKYEGKTIPSNNGPGTKIWKYKYVTVLFFFFQSYPDLENIEIKFQTFSKVNGELSLKS